MKNHYFEKECFERFLIRKGYKAKKDTVKVSGKYIQCVLTDDDVYVLHFDTIVKMDDGIHVRMKLANIPSVL